MYRVDRLAIDDFPSLVWFMSDYETYGRVNLNYADFLGKNKEEIEFHNIRDIFPRDTITPHKQLYRDAFQNKRTTHSEEWITNSCGDSRLIAITRSPQLDQNGNVEYIVCFGFDITDRKRVEDQQLQSENNFRSFIETIDDIAVIGNTSGKIIYANPAAVTKIGYSSEELKTMHILDLHPTWNRQEATSILNDMFNGKRATCPLPLASKSGSLIPVETRIWHGKWNGLDCVFGLSKDLTKEQEALQKFDKFFRMNPALMAVSTIPDQKFIDVNEAFVIALGYTEEEILGKSSLELGLFSDAEGQRRAVELLTKYGSIRGIELKVRTKGDSCRDGLFSGEVIESQGVRYFLTVMIDITDRKRAEAERESVIQELQSAIEQIKTLKGIVPICCNCKKIRNDKGYWEKVEAYVARHTEAQFSHGICPDCEKKLYSRFLEPKQFEPN